MTATAESGDVAAPRLRRICVFCGSSPGADPRYREVAAELGDLLARERLGLVYGGGNVGLMAVVADAVLAAGGEVLGVIPRALAARELAHTGIQDLRVVDTMHQRKAMMADHADAFIALPGGLGTLEEFFEVITWAQLGIHDKPCGLLNVAGFFDWLIRFLDLGVAQRFVRAEHRALVQVAERPRELLSGLRRHRPSQRDKWLDRDQT